MAQKLLKNLFVIFGFINGFFFSLGIRPQQEVIKFLQPILSDLHPIFKALFIILPSILIIGTMISALRIYHKGGLLGAGAVALAFLAGALITSQWITGIIILVVAIVLGSLTFGK